MAKVQLRNCLKSDLVTAYARRHDGEKVSHQSAADPDVLCAVACSSGALGDRPASRPDFAKGLCLAGNANASSLLRRHPGVAARATGEAIRKAAPSG